MSLPVAALISRAISLLPLLAIGLLASGLPGARANQQARTTPVHRALLIGVNDYAANDSPSAGEAWIPADLRGAINDIVKMRALLTSRFGFEEKSIRTLRDREATRDAILDEMRKIVDETGPDDVVYIHFSGHGSQAPDTDGDETDDGLDETILPHDARTEEVRDITDDELREILSGLKTRNALIVLDSCHSGTATREASAIRTRMVPADPRTKLYATNENKKKVATRSAEPASADYVLMTGAASHQAALDGPIDGDFYGFFSYALGKALTNAPARATPRDVHASVLKEFERLAAHFGLMGMPEPQVEGPDALTGSPLLRASDARLAWAEVRPAGKGQVVLVRAVPLGARTGATWAIYSSGDTEFQPGRALASATVTGTEGDDAVARIEPASPPLPAGCRAVAVAPPPASDRVPVRLDRVQQGMRAALEQALHKLSPNVQFVGPDELARFILDVEDGVARLYGAHGLQEVVSVAAEDAGTIAARIADELSRSVNAAALLSLDNPASAMQLDVRVVPAGANGTTRGVKVVAASDTPAYRIRRSGESRSAENSLMLEVLVGQDSYVTVVDVDTEGGVNVLFPNAFSAKRGFYPEGKLPGGLPIRLPDSLESPNRAGFFWDYHPPAGLDTLRVFAMADLESARKLRDYIGTLKPATATRGDGDAQAHGAAKPVTAFRDLARDLATAATTRGIMVVPDGEQPEPGVPAPAKAKPPHNPDWTAASLTLVIEE